MGDETVKSVNELHVILRGISTQDAGEETLFLEFFRIASLHGSGVLGVRWKSFDPARLASSSRGPSQLAHRHNCGQTAPVFGLLEGNGSV